MPAVDSCLNITSIWFFALHTDCDNGASMAVIQCLVEAYPKGVEDTTTDRSTPLQLCVYKNGGDMFGNTPLQLLLRYADIVMATFVSPPPTKTVLSGSRWQLTLTTTNTTMKPTNLIFSVSSYSTSPEAAAKCVGLLDATLDVMTKDDKDKLDYYYQYHRVREVIL